jgi:hypothetical protein
MYVILRHLLNFSYYNYSFRRNDNFITNGDSMSVGKEMVVISLKVRVYSDLPGEADEGDKKSA